MHKHEFSDKEKLAIRFALLEWYSCNKRHLPWREAIIHPDRNVRAYSIWVSEIMLQQTQVVTVIDYYKRWIKKWPTVSDLANASSDEVHQMWSGLGYYSRARRLHEGAQIVVTKFGGIIPESSTELQKLPGIGRYSACAIASLAFNETKGVVDGNVIRVLTRIRAVGLETNDRKVIDWLWRAVDDLVDRDKPGEFNQAIMELGALVCTPNSPSCSTCPLNSYCWAFKRSKTELPCAPIRTPVSKLSGEMPSIESVTNYPRKAKKKKPREEHIAVAVICSRLSVCESSKYLITKRPDKGLLANLWEFPSIKVEAATSIKKMNALLINFLSSQFFGSTFRNRRSSLKWKGEVLHVFSHIRCTYVVFSMELKGDLTANSSNQLWKWVTELELREAAVSTAMKKVFHTAQDRTAINKSTKISKRKNTSDMS